jgi:hypothetical protein
VSPPLSLGIVVPRARSAQGYLRPWRKRCFFSFAVARLPSRAQALSVKLRLQVFHPCSGPYAPQQDHGMAQLS